MMVEGREYNAPVLPARRHALSSLLVLVTTCTCSATAHVLSAGEADVVHAAGLSPPTRSRASRRPAVSLGTTLGPVMGLNAKSFGAVGDGIHDDTEALQAAIDEAQNSRRRLLLPAGTYVLRDTLYVRCYDSWVGACRPSSAKGPLHMTGEGLSQTELVAQNSGAGKIPEATIKIVAGLMGAGANYTAGDKINHTNFHTLEHFTITAQDPNTTTRRDYAILAPGLTRTTFSHLQFGGAAVAGLWSSGWCNRVEHCRFGGNEVGLVMAQDANGNHVANSAFEGNMGTAIAVMEGELVTITNCVIEGNGGPGIIAVAVKGLLITGCYFEANNRAHWSLSPWDPTPYAAAQGNYSIQSDIVLNGAFPPFGDPFQHVWRGYVSQAVQIEGNSFAPTSLNASGVLLAAVQGVQLSANVAVGHTQEQPSQQMALVSTGNDPASFFAQDITLSSSNVGWRHSAGPVGILRPNQLPAHEAWKGDSAIDGQTFAAAQIEQRNMLGRRGCCAWMAQPDLPPPPRITPRGEFDGRPVIAWAHAASDTTVSAAGTAALVWSTNLSTTPSIAGQLVYFGLRAALAPSASTSTTVSLWIDPGTGRWESACATPPARPFEHQVPGCLRPPSGVVNQPKQENWQRLSYSTVLQTEGLARFAVHVSNADELMKPQRDDANGGSEQHTGSDNYLALFMAGDTVSGGPEAGMDAAVVVAPVGASWNQIVQ